MRFIFKYCVTIYDDLHEHVCIRQNDRDTEEKEENVIFQTQEGPVLERNLNLPSPPSHPESMAFYPLMCQSCQSSSPLWLKHICVRDAIDWTKQKYYRQKTKAKCTPCLCMQVSVELCSLLGFCRFSLCPWQNTQFNISIFGQETCSGVHKWLGLECQGWQWIHTSVLELIVTR